MHASFFSEFFFFFVSQNCATCVGRKGRLNRLHLERLSRVEDINHRSKEVPPPGGKHNRGQGECHLHGNSRARDASKFSLIRERGVRVNADQIRG